MQLSLIVLLSLTGLSPAKGQQNNKTKRWLENEANGIQYPSAYQQVPLDDSTKSIGASRYSNSYNTPQPLILFTPAAALERQEARVRHIYLKPTPSSAPPPSSTTIRAKNQKLEAQPQLHSYSTFILPPQLQSAVVPTTFPIRHQPTAYYGYATIPPVTSAPVQQQQFVKHVYLDQKHPVLHYHYQTYQNAKPLVIHNTIPQNAPKTIPNQEVKEVTEPQEEEVNEEVRDRENEEEEEVEGAPEKENVQEDDEEESEEREPVREQENNEEREEREDDGESEKENLEEEDEEEGEEKENLEEEEEEEDNRKNNGPQVFYRNNNNNEEDDESDEKKQYRNEESEDEEEEENQRHDVKIKPNFGFDYQRLAEQYKNIQYPSPVGPIRVPIRTNVEKSKAKKKNISNKNSKPYPNVSKKPIKIKKPNAKATGANVNVRLPYLGALNVPKINNVEQQKQAETNQKHTVPVFYQRLRNYFTPTPIINSQ